MSSQGADAVLTCREGVRAICGPDSTPGECASHDNAKCARYFTRAEDGLAQDWGESSPLMTTGADRRREEAAWQKGR